MLISALVAERYVSDDHRDGVSLYKTFESLKNRLAVSTTVFSPADSSDFTNKSEHLNQVKRLKKELDKHFPRLSILNSATCTADQANSAWDWIFNHSFWHVQTIAEVQKSLSDTEYSRSVAMLGGPQYTLKVRCGLTHQDNSPSTLGTRAMGLDFRRTLAFASP